MATSVLNACTLHCALSRWSSPIVKDSMLEHKACRIAEERVHSTALLPKLPGHAVQHDAVVCCICATKSSCKSRRSSQRLLQHSKKQCKESWHTCARMAMVSCAPGPGQPTPQRRCGRGLSPGGVGGTLRCSLLAASVRPAGRPARVCTTRHRSRTMRRVSVPVELQLQHTSEWNRLVRFAAANVQLRTAA